MNVRGTAQAVSRHIVEGGLVVPSPHALIVRLPSGNEYWFAEDVPAVGEIVTHYGRRYVVLSAEPIEEERVVVTLAEEEVRAEPIAKSPLT